MLFDMGILKENMPIDMIELDIKNIRKVYLSKNFKDKDIIEFIQKNKIKYVISDPKVMDGMLRNNQGIIVDINDYEYSNLESIDSDFVIILDHLEDPHNFGAIIRTSEAMGIKHIIIPKDRSVSVNETVMKTSAGALNHVNIIQVPNLVNAINYLKDNGFFVYGAEADGINYNTEITFCKDIAQTNCQTLKLTDTFNDGFLEDSYYKDNGYCVYMGCRFNDIEFIYLNEKETDGTQKKGTINNNGQKNQTRKW